jgi:protein phosphatase
MERTSWGLTDPGLVRPNNEDAIYRDDEIGLYVVADGVGGHSAGEQASRTAVETLSRAGRHLHRLVELYDEDPNNDQARRDVFDSLQEAVERANHHIFGYAQQKLDFRGMMTTGSVVLLSRSAAFVAHVGDSRIYLHREGEMEQLTTDHTLAEALVEAGQLSRDEIADYAFRNILARALGEQGTVEVDLLYVDLRPLDRLLLCSDGITGYAELTAINAVITNTDGENPAADLIELANKGGGGDNSTAIVVELTASDAETDSVITQRVPLEHTVKVDLLQNLFFCHHLSPEERMKVLRYVHEVHFEEGECVVEQGAEGQELYMVVEGELDVRVDSVLVNQVKPGGHFGEIALVSGQKRSAEVIARTPVRAFRMAREGFYDLGKKEQAIAVKMLWAFTQSLANRVMELSQDVVDERKKQE